MLYHPQSNGQVEGYNRTLVVRLRYYIDERQTSWDLFSQPIIYKYNMQMHRTKWTSPYSLILSRKLSKALALQNSTGDDISQHSPWQTELVGIEFFNQQMNKKDKSSLLFLSD